MILQTTNRRFVIGTNSGIIFLFIIYGCLKLRAGLSQGLENQESVVFMHYVMKTTTKTAGHTDDFYR